MDKDTMELWVQPRLKCKEIEDLQAIINDAFDSINDNVLMDLNNLYYVDGKSFWIRADTLNSALNTLNSSFECAKMYHFADA